MSKEDEDGCVTYVYQNKLSLTEEEKTRLIFHSFTNGLNVLLDAIGKCRVCLNATDDVIFSNSLDLASKVGRSLEKVSSILELVGQLPVLNKTIQSDTQQAKQIFARLEKLKTSPSFSTVAASFWAKIHWIENQLLPISEIRAKELTYRLKLPADAWVLYHTETLRKNMEIVLLAVAQGTSHISGIVFDQSHKKPRDICILMQFKGIKEGLIQLPPIFQDVFRDIVMNARKYSFPGGDVEASMINDGKTLTISVADHGMGIDSAEVSHIIEFGVRGSNVSSRRTMGGGFGLTKAYFFTKQFHGVFKVHTGIGVGSTFTAQIPCPVHFKETDLSSIDNG